MRHFLFLTGMLPLLIVAQDPSFVWHTPRSQYLFPEEAPRAYVLGNDVALRSGPHTSGGLVATLNAGTSLTVLERGVDTLEVRGVRSLWYEVSVGERKGWLWGGNIAQRAFGSTADATVKFIAGLDQYQPPDTGRVNISYRIIALRTGREVDRIVVRSFGWGFDEVRNVGNLGVLGVDDIISLGVPCTGGCGCSTGEVLVFWSSGKFHHVADLMGSPDGEWSNSTTFLFPSDMEGLPGTIIRVTSDYDETPIQEMEYGNPETITRFVTREYLRWDGKVLVPSGKKKEVTSYKLAVDN